MESKVLLAWKVQHIRKAKRKGYMARMMGRSLLQNPYGGLEDQEHDAWIEGWSEASESVSRLQVPHAA